MKTLKILSLVAVALVAFLLFGCRDTSTTVSAVASPASSASPGEVEKTAILAGGCFWCLEHDLKKLEGVLDAESGYSGGDRPNPTYKNYHDLTAEYKRPHVEVVKVTYDSSKLSYQELLNYFFRHIDPVDSGGQFCDRGAAYRPVVYAENEEEVRFAETVSSDVEKLLGQEIATPIEKREAFWPAEDYHQDFSEKNPKRYELYRWKCGRDQRVKELWGAVEK